LKLTASLPRVDLFQFWKEHSEAKLNFTVDRNVSLIKNKKFFQSLEYHYLFWRYLNTNVKFEFEHFVNQNLELNVLFMLFSEDHDQW
jgi:hypothetical protein